MSSERRGSTPLPTASSKKKDREGKEPEKGKKTRSSSVLATSDAPKVKTSKSTSTTGGGDSKPKAKGRERRGSTPLPSASSKKKDSNGEEPKKGKKTRSSSVVATSDAPKVKTSKSTSTTGGGDSKPKLKKTKTAAKDVTALVEDDRDKITIKPYSTSIANDLMKPNVFISEDFDLPNGDKTSTTVKILFGIKWKKTPTTDADGKKIFLHTLPHKEIETKKVKAIRDAVVAIITYGWQSSAGRAMLVYILQNLGKKNKITKVDLTNVKRIEICMNYTAHFNPDEVAVHIDPFSVMSVIDFAMTTPSRSKWLSKAHENCLFTRPENNLVSALMGDSTNYVFGIQSPGALFFHELGHFVQYIQRPHFFTQAYREAVKRVSDRKYLEGIDPKHLITDVTIPWEADNLNWREIPFCEDMRKLGIMECLRWHYSDSLKMEKFDAIGTTRTNGVIAFRYKKGDEWYHANSLWGIKKQSDGITLKSGIKSTFYGTQQDSITQALENDGGCTIIKISTETKDLIANRFANKNAYFVIPDSLKDQQREHDQVVKAGKKQSKAEAEEVQKVLKKDKARTELVKKMQKEEKERKKKEKKEEDKKKKEEGKKKK